MNLVELVILNRGSPLRARLLVIWDSGEYRVDLGLLSGGERGYHVYIPDIRERVPVTFSLRDSRESLLDEVTIDWKPKRHWLVYVVQYSHHDLGYTDLPQNVLEEYASIYDLIVRFCEETADWPEDAKFRYQIEQVWSLLHYIRTRSRNEVERLMSLIRSGRLGVSALLGNEVTGLCGHEEIVRLVYPAFRLKRRYGIPLKVAELNDVPGFSWGLASVLAGSGIRFFAPLIPRWYYQPGRALYWDEEVVTPRGIPTAFWWESIDGSRVLFWYQDIRFAEDVGFLESYDKLLEKLPVLLDALEEDYPFNAILIRISGGLRDNAPPSLRPCYIAREWNERWAYPRIIVSTLSDFFEYLENNYEHVLDRLPVFRGEVPDTDYPVGATSLAQATALNRNSHDLVASAEKFATIAYYTVGLPYPYREYLERAYEHSLLYDEHTWGLLDPIGPAQEASRIEKELHAYKAYALAHDVLVKSLNRIVDNIDLPESGYYIVVFNPLSWSRTDVVRVQLREPDPCGHPMFKATIGGEKPITVMKAGAAIGRPLIRLPSELLEKPPEVVDIVTGRRVEHRMAAVNDPDSPTPFAADRVGLAPVDNRYVMEMVFVAEDVPPLGYKVFKVESSRTPLEPASPLKEVGTSSEDEYVIENEFYRVEVDSKTGVIVSIYDKELERELVDRSAPHGFNQIVVRESPTLKEHFMDEVRVEKGVKGPVMRSIVVRGRAPGCPSVVQEVILYDRIKRIDIRNRVIRDSTPLLEIYFAFPFNVSSPRFKYEGPNVVVTPIEDQLPGSHTCYYPVQHWVNIHDVEEGFSIVWTSVDAHLVKLGGLWPTRVSRAHRSVTPSDYSHRDLRVISFNKGYIYSFVMNNDFRTNFYVTQRADVTFRYSITSYKGDWRSMIPRNSGWSAAVPLVPVVVEGGRRGSLPGESCTFCEVDKPNVTITTIKPAEEEGYVIIRLSENAGIETEVTISLPFMRVEEAYLANIVEEPLTPLPVTCYDKSRVTVIIKPFTIVNLKLKLAR
ncbi:MAG: hypothetical protein DRK00_07595 [Thermoprotei archaeon]|nr:MAG: hypothetical protein DRK00_07595 [Thermoprotei archaeon]